MSITTLYAELVVVGSGTVIFILLLLYGISGNQAWWAKLQTLSSLQSAIYLVPVLSIIYLLGIVIANLSHLLFKDTEEELRREVLKSPETVMAWKEDSYAATRNILYTSPDFKDLVQEFEFRRSKVRICRGWCLNSILILFAIDVCWLTGKVPCLLACFGVVLFSLLMIGTGISWEVATRTELDWFREFSAHLARTRNAKEPTPG